MIINLFNKNKFPEISNSLAIFSMSLLTSYGDRLLPPRVIDFLNTNRAAQLLMTYMLILFSIDIYGNVNNIFSSFLYAFVILTIFIVICKQSNIFFFTTIILLLITYFVNKQKKIYEKNNPVWKETISKIDYIEKKLIFITSSIVTLGFLIYFIKQYKNHRHKSSNIFMFILRLLYEGSERHY